MNQSSAGSNFCNELIENVLHGVDFRNDNSTGHRLYTGTGDDYNYTYYLLSKQRRKQMLAHLNATSKTAERLLK